VYTDRVLQSTPYNKGQKYMKKKKVAFKEKGPKDDGSRWIIIGENGYQVYLGPGVKKATAQHLADGLVQSATLEMVSPPPEG
jgi:hypothetical protein